MGFKVSALIALLMVAAPAGVAATENAGRAPVAEAGAPELEGEASPVDVGVYVNQIRGMDLRTSQFTADFWIWFRWRDGEVDPSATFEVVGGQVESKAGEVREELEGGIHYATARVVAIIHQQLDLSRFPLDAHTLAIVIEDTAHDSKGLRYVPDALNSRIDQGVHVPGFQLGAFRPTLSNHTYLTNYGDLSLPSDSGSTYSRVEFQIDLFRPGIGYLLKLFWSVYLSAGVALLAFLIKPTDLDARFGMGVGALFAAMASAYIISSALPETNQMTLADQASMIAVGVIFLSLTGSTASLYLFSAGHEQLSRKLDRIGLWVLSAGYTALNVAVLLR